MNIYTGDSIEYRDTPDLLTEMQAVMVVRHSLHNLSIC